MMDLSQVDWRKSHRSTQQGECVEVADLRDRAAVTDNVNPDDPQA
jgi:hypothetical protein